MVIMGFLVKKEKKKEERVVEMGCLNLVKWRRRWGENGGGIGGGVGGDGGECGRPRRAERLLWGCCWLSLAVGGEERRKKNERERGRNGGGYIKEGNDYYNIAIPLHKETCVSTKWLRPHEIKFASGQTS